MQSLNLKLLTDFSTGARRYVPGRSFGTEWRQCLNLRNYSRNCRIVACSVERDGGGEGASSSSSSSSDPNPSSFLSRSQTYAMLKQQMEVAAQSEVTFFIIISILWNNLNLIKANFFLFFKKKYSDLALLFLIG
jgi:ApaG protein